LIDKTGFVFTLETLNYLRAGGRASRLVRIDSNLKIFSVFAIKDGKIVPLEQVRTRKKSFQVMAEYVALQKNNEGNFSLSIVHANVDERALELKNILEAKIPSTNIDITYCSPVLIAHSGPGAIGVAWNNSPIT
jgi:DegV family protein with EDD domain